MEYFVIGSDGSKYGPAQVPTLQQWASEGRINAQTILEDQASGQRISASSVAGIFAAPSAPTPPQAPPPMFDSPSQTQYLHPPSSHSSAEGPGVLTGVVVRSVLGIILFFVLHGIGLIVAGYGLYYAIQLKSNGSKYGTAAVLIAGASFGVIAIGWFLRLNSFGV